MSAVIGALRGVLSLDSAAFDKGAARAQASMSSLQRSLAGTGERAQRVGRQMSLRLSAPLAAAATVAVKSSLRIVDSQAKAAQSMDTTVVSMQNLDRAASLAGISAGDLDGSLRRMTRRISLAEQGAGPAADALERLGLSAEDLNKLPVDQRVDRINSAIRELIPAAEQAGVASQIFGDRTGLAILRLDSDVLARAERDVDRFGVAVSDVDAAQIEAANDAMSALGLITRGLANQITVALAPVLQSLAESAQQLGEWFNDLSPPTRRLIAAGTALTAALGPAVLTLGLMATGLAALVSPIGAVVLGLGAVAGVALAVAANWDTLTARFPVLETAATRTGGALRVAWDGVKERVGGAIESIGAGAQGVADLFNGDLKSALDNFITAAQGIENPLMTAAKSWGKIIKAIVVPEWDLAGFEAIRAFIDGVLRGWKDNRQEIIDALTFGGDIMERFRKLGTNIGESLSEAINDTAGSVASAGRNVARGTVNATKDEVEARSPSRVFMRIGRDMMEGLAIGVRNNAQPAIDAARQAASQAASQANFAVQEFTGAFGDFVATGLRDFETFSDTISRSFNRLVSDLVATAVANPIRLTLGLTAAGGATATAATLSTSGASGAANLLGLGGLAGGGGFFSGIGAGLQQALGAGSAGLLNIGANATTASALTGASSLATGIGAALPIVGIVGALAALPSIFKKTTEVVDEGVRFAVRENRAFLEEFTKTRTASRFGAGRYGTDFDPLTGELNDTLSGIINSGRDRIAELAGTFGATLPTIGFSRDVKFAGLNESERQQALLQAANDAVERQAAAFFDGANASLLREGESGIAALERLGTSLAGVNSLFEQMDMALFDVSTVGAEMASQLVEAFGSLDNLGGSVNTYLEAFYSQEEQLALLTQNLERQLASINVVMPETREEFRRVVDGLDLTAEKGRETYATLIGLAGGFDTVFAAAEDAAAALKEQAEATARAEASARATAEAQKQREAAAANQARAQAASAGLRSAESALRAAIGARQSAIETGASNRIAEVQAATEAALERLRSRLGARQQQVQQYRGFRDALTDAIADRRTRDIFNPGGQLEAASALLRDAAGRNSVRNMAGIREAIQTVSAPSTDLFRSFADYQREFSVNTAAIEKIRDLAGAEVSDAQKQIAALEANAAAISARGAEQVAAIETARDAEIGKLSSLLTATVGVETAVLSVRDALAGYASAMRQATAANALVSAPAFAGGGFHLGGFRLVGERGPELEATGPSRIYSSQQTQRMLSGGDLGREMAGLRRDMAALAETSAAQRRELERQRRLFDQWNQDGLPATRQVGESA